MERLKACGVKFEGENVNIGSKLQGLSFCITGTLPTLSRNEAADLIERNGGKVVSSVSSRTDYLVEGEAAGSKAVKARTLGIKIINEEELLAMTENEDSKDE